MSLMMGFKIREISIKMIKYDWQTYSEYQYLHRIGIQISS